MRQIFDKGNHDLSQSPFLQRSVAARKIYPDQVKNEAENDVEKEPTTNNNSISEMPVNMEDVLNEKVNETCIIQVISSFRIKLRFFSAKFFSK